MKDLIENLTRFPKFFALIVLGILSVFVGPLLPLLKRPNTAIALVVAAIGTFIGLVLILRAMLGLEAL